MNRFVWIIVVVSLVGSRGTTAEPQWKLGHKLQGHDSSIVDVEVTSDGKLLATASYDKTIVLWDLATGKKKAVLRGHEHWLETIAFSSDGKLLASSSDDNTIRLWNVATAKQVASWPTESEARTLNFSPDGKLLVSGCDDRTIRLTDIRTKKHRTIETGHRARVYDLVFSPDGKAFATNGYYDVSLWDRTGKKLKTIEGRVTSMVFSADSKMLTVAVGHRISQWAVPSVKPLLVREGKAFTPRDEFSAVLSPDGKTLATIDKDLIGVGLGQGVAPGGAQRCQIVLMDIATGKERQLFETRGRKRWFGPMWYSPSGKLLALSNADDDSVRLVDAVTGRQLAKFSDPEGKVHRQGRVSSVVFGPDGKTVITTHKKTVAVWVSR